jgi:hypothetical protein
MTATMQILEAPLTLSEQEIACVAGGTRGGGGIGPMPSPDFGPPVYFQIVRPGRECPCHV